MLQHSEQRQRAYEECAGAASDRFATDPIRQDPDRHRKVVTMGPAADSKKTAKVAPSRTKLPRNPRFPGADEETP